MVYGIQFKKLGLATFWGAGSLLSGGRYFWGGGGRYFRDLLAATKIDVIFGGSLLSGGRYYRNFPVALFSCLTTKATLTVLGV